jgi:peptide chain release factor 1
MKPVFLQVTYCVCILKYCENKGWTTEIMNENAGTAGGYKEVVVEVSGDGVYGVLKYESGVHRVQRVPETESQGRVHTSAASVAVLPEAEEVDVDINPADIKKDVYRASGAGGQHVNKTESAVRLTHIPTNTIAECQDGRSQHKNYESAMKVLRTRLYEKALAVHNEAIAKQRKTLVSTGDRSAKIRTYNYPQGRVTDHRINLTMYNLGEIMNGDLQSIIDKLNFEENAEKLKVGWIVRIFHHCEARSNLLNYVEQIASYIYHFRIELIKKNVFAKTYSFQQTQRNTSLNTLGDFKAVKSATCHLK